MVAAINHYVDVGDPHMAGEDVAVCKCGWRTRVPDSEDMTTWEIHVMLMALAAGHVYANAWRFVEGEE